MLLRGGGIVVAVVSPEGVPPHSRAAEAEAARLSLVLYGCVGLLGDPDVDGGWKVFDVIVEGVSYVQTYRAQFEELLRTQTLDQVIAGLKADAIQLEG